MPDKCTGSHWSYFGHGGRFDRLGRMTKHEFVFSGFLIFQKISQFLAIPKAPSIISMSYVVYGSLCQAKVHTLLRLELWCRALVSQDVRACLIRKGFLAWFLDTPSWFKLKLCPKKHVILHFDLLLSWHPQTLCARSIMSQQPPAAIAGGNVNSSRKGSPKLKGKVYRKIMHTVQPCWHISHNTWWRCHRHSILKWCAFLSAIQIGLQDSAGTLLCCSPSYEPPSQKELLHVCVKICLGILCNFFL